MTRRDSIKILRDTMKIYYLDLEYFDQKALTRYEYEDTGITQFRFFDPSVKMYTVNASLGNLGTANQPMFFKPWAFAGFDAGYHSFDAYLFNRWNTPFYLTARPVSRVAYFLGMGSEQHLQVMHTQRILKNLQLGIEYNHISSGGFYRNQKAITHHFRFTGRYNTADGRYKLIWAYIHNNLFINENGALRNDTDFIDNPNAFSRSYLVNLDSAMQRWFNHTAFVQHGFTFNRKNTDSTEQTKSPLLTFMHTLEYEYRTNRFRDGRPNLSYYGDVYYDSAFTRHGLEYHQLQNEFKVLLYLRKKADAQSPVTAGIKHEFVALNDFIGVKNATGFEYDSSALYASYHNLNAFGGIVYDITPRIHLDASGYFYFAGYNLGDFGAKFSFHYQSKDTAKVHQQLTASVQYRQFEPAYFYQHFLSNHRQWSVDLDKQRELHASVIYKIKSWNLDLEFNSYLVNNYTYLDSTIQPLQIADVANIFTLQLHKRFRAWKIYFDPYLIGQYSSTDRIRVPFFTGRLSVYFQGYIFKKALLLNAGFDISYHTPYNGNAYDPVTAGFYLQNGFTTGNYPFLDVYLSGKIKQVRVFVRLRNVNQRWPDVPYYSTPHYPMQDRSVQFGISWNFLN